jgi:protein required for attachment to host cells
MARLKPNQPKRNGDAADPRGRIPFCELPRVRDKVQNSESEFGSLGSGEPDFDDPHERWPMNTVWVLVCDSAKARFFEVGGPDSSWQLVSEVSHEESRSKASDLVSDHSGTRSSEGRSVHHNALAPASSPKEVEHARFAHSLGQTLDQAMRSARFRRWVLVAPPHFLGLMKRELTPELQRHLLATVDREMTQVDARGLAHALRDTVRIPVDQQDALREPHKQTH